jgi:hypothetical protein
MKITALLADSCVNAEGKLYIQGAGWNIINVPTLPYIQDRIGIGLIVHVPYTATNQEHRFELTLVDADETELPIADAPQGVELPPDVEAADGKIRKLQGRFNVGRPPTLPAGDDQVIALAVNINGLPFNELGQYSFVIKLDGSEEERLSFRVQQPPQLVAAAG